MVTRCFRYESIRKSILVMCLMILVFLFNVQTMQSMSEVEYQIIHDKADLSSKVCLKRDIHFGEPINDRYVDDSFKFLKDHKTYSTYVSEPRLRATYYLSQAALLLPSRGDFVETGLAKGGSAAVMLQVLQDFDNCGTQFYGYDSFEGIPDPVSGENEYGSKKRKGTYANTQQVFEENIRNLGLWNDSVLHITKGWFNDTLPHSQVKQISFLRLDGDVYVSTRDALLHLYDKVVPGGYIYADDYGSFQGCRRAIDEFRTKHKIYETMYHIREKKNNRYIHFEAVFWRKRIS